jgi:hypothetical protein
VRMTLNSSYLASWMSRNWKARFVGLPRASFPELGYTYHICEGSKNDAYIIIFAEWSILKIEGVQKIPGPISISTCRDMRRRIVFDSLMYSLPFSGTQARYRIQS